MKTYVVAPGQSMFAHGRLYVEGDKVQWPDGKPLSRAFVVPPGGPQPKPMPEPAESYRQAMAAAAAKVEGERGPAKPAAPSIVPAKVPSK